MKKVRIARLILNSLGYVTVGLLAVFMAVVLLSHLNGNLFFLGKHALVWILTDSMEDTIPAQSYIVVEKVDPDSVSVGDVIVYRSDDPEIAGMFNTHRVVGIVGDRESFVMKGDNNLRPDSYNADPEKIAGRYVKNAPETLSAIGRFLSTQMGIITSATTIFALFIVLCMPGISDAIRRKSDEMDAEKKALIDRLVAEELERLKAGQAPGPLATDRENLSAAGPAETAPDPPDASEAAPDSPEPS